VAVEHPKRADRALRRDVHVAVGGERSRRHEEQRLGVDPVAQSLVDLVEDLAHGERISPRGRAQRDEKFRAIGERVAWACPAGRLRVAVGGHGLPLENPAALQ
jgi:hypothetical protein